MQTALNAIFALELALLFTHEMDAIRRQEWKLFIVLKDLDDEKAYQIFTMLHIPLYATIMFVLFSDWSVIGLYVMDVFLLAHMLVHWGFRKHQANNLNNGLSKGIIYFAGILALFHLLAISL